MKRLLGLYREQQYSPGRHQSNDRLLLDDIAEHLRARDFEIDVMRLEEANGHAAKAAAILSMCQGKSSLENLAAWERNGATIINSPRSALNTHRDRLPNLMAKAGVAFPQTKLIRMNNREPVDLNGGVWLKRGDVHAAVAADVQWVDSREKFETGLADFAQRGIETAAVQTHHQGDEIKFYGVTAGRFFHWFYSSEAHGYLFDPEKLQTLAHRAATAAGLEIFGGDVIVSPAGELTLIDLNDWPSFAPCREQASQAIAEFIAEKIDAD